MTIYVETCRRCDYELRAERPEWARTVMREHIRIEHPMLAASWSLWRTRSRRSSR